MNIEHLMTDPYMVLNSGLMNSGLMDALLESPVVTSDGWSLKEAFGPLSNFLWDAGDAIRDTGADGYWTEGGLK